VFKLLVILLSLLALPVVTWLAFLFNFGSWLLFELFSFEIGLFDGWGDDDVELGAGDELGCG
jgi:hypothetical protein